jgi:glucose-1-phosphate adenylyltransferase
MANSARNVLAVILGGGAGTRLFPLTRERAKPAVPVGGKYRLVDIPISNCINSELRKIYILTQFNSASLHRHLSHTYKFDPFTGGFVEVLAAEQTIGDASWYQGTADAVRKNLSHLLAQKPDHILILSGDQLYRMDFRAIIDHHIKTDAELTLATMPVPRDTVPGLGILRADETGRISHFVEKPKDPAAIDQLRVPPDWYGRLGIKGSDEFFLASMGIYVFKRDVLVEVLKDTHPDFGKHIIPNAIGARHVQSYVFQGYWEDIGTIRAFFEANLELSAELPRFNFFDMAAPMFSRPRWLPGSKINNAVVDHAVVCDGCIITDAQLNHSIVGIRSIVGHGSRLTRTVMMGCDFYESAESIAQSRAQGIPPMGIGANTQIEDTIIDKNARIGNNVVISAAGKSGAIDHPLYFVRDGVVIIPKGAIIPDGTVI